MSWLILSTLLVAVLVVAKTLVRRRTRLLSEIDAIPVGQDDTPSRSDAEAAEPPSERPNDVVPLAILKLLEPMASWRDEQLAVFAHEHRSETHPAGAALFRRGEPTDHAFYLLKGQIEIDFESRSPAVVDAGDPEARFPLGCGARFPVTCIPRTEVEMLRVPQTLLRSNRAKKDVHGIDTTALGIPPVLAQSSAFFVFCRSFDSKRMELPGIPQVAVRLRQAMRKREVDMDEVAELVLMDPAMSAKLIHVANSPLYASAKPVSTCHGAIVRLGLEATQNIIFCIGLRQMFSSKHAAIRHRVQKIWEDSLTVSALSSVLASTIGSVEPDRALLAGLVYRIGAIPFLNFMDKLPPDSYREEEIDAALAILTGPVGRYVLREWDFPAEYQDLPVAADDWFADGGRGVDLGDILRLAVWHARVADRREVGLPPIIALPCYAKLENRALTADFSLDLLRHAQAQVDATRKILTG